MQIADLSTGAAQLRDAADVLAVRWDDTRQQWRDANSREIEENHLAPLATEINAALGAMSRLSQVFAQAQRECEAW